MSDDVYFILLFSGVDIARSGRYDDGAMYDGMPVMCRRGDDDEQRAVICRINNGGSGVVARMMMISLDSIYGVFFFVKSAVLVLLILSGSSQGAVWQLWASRRIFYSLPRVSRCASLGAR
jgi:hypothetical protein